VFNDHVNVFFASERILKSVNIFWFDVMQQTKLAKVVQSILSLSNWFCIVSFYRGYAISAAEDVSLRCVKCGRRSHYATACATSFVCLKRSRFSRVKETLVLCSAAAEVAVISITAPAGVDSTGPVVCPDRLQPHLAATGKEDGGRGGLDYDVYFWQVRPAGVCITLRILIGT